MSTAAVFYATRHGHARKVAERIGARLAERGVAVEMHELASKDLPASLAAYAAVVLVASIQMGRHEKELIRFVTARRAELERARATFVSVSMADGDVERASDTLP